MLSSRVVGEATRTRHRSVLQSRRGAVVLRWYEWQPVFHEVDVWSHGGWYVAGGSGAYAGAAGPATGASSSPTASSGTSAAP